MQNSGIALFLRELFAHDNLSYRYSRLIHVRESPRKSPAYSCCFGRAWSRMCRVSLRVAPTYHVASCFSVGFLKGYEVKYHTTASNKRQVSVLVVKKPQMFFACFAFVHMALHAMAGRGGVYVRGLHGLFSLDLSMNGIHVALTTRFPVKSCSFSWPFLSVTHHFCFLRNALLTCVHLRFPSCWTSRIDVEPGC